MKNQEVIEYLENFIERYWRDSNQSNYSDIPDYIVETIIDDEKFKNFVLNNENPKFFLILFKYKGVGYMDIVCRNEDYNQKKEGDRQWFREATKSAVERQNISKKGINTVIEPCLFEIVIKSQTSGESMSVEVIYPPIDALDTVILDKEVFNDADTSNTEQIS